MAAAHTDFPCFRLKPAAEINTNGYGTLNVEGYGGMIVSTWLDRPLGLAGKIVTRTDKPFAPKVHWWTSNGRCSPWPTWPSI